VIICRGEGVKEGDEEWEGGTWGRKREVEMKEWQLERLIMYIDDRPDKRRTEDGAEAELILPFLEANIALFCSLFT
jgi:hypothetical protein